MMNIQKMSTLALAISALAITGCSSDSNDPTPAQSDQQEQDKNQDSSINTTTIDASDYDNYKYFNLTTGEVVDLTAEAAATSSDWHIALRRTEVIVNGGDSGSANVQAALAAAQDDFFDTEGAADNNVFMNATADSEEEHLTANYDLTALAFSADKIVPAIKGAQEDIGGGVYDYGWYNYNSNNHQLSVNDGNWWLIKSNTGTSFAKFRATEYDRTDGLNATFEFDVQAEGTSQFSGTPLTFNVIIPASGGEVCYDFDADAIVDCATSSDWDIKADLAGRSQNLWVNGGVTADGNGGAFGPFSTTDITDYVSGDTSNGTSLTRLYTTDRTEGVFSESSWYAYNLGGNHKLWPNFRTYIVDTDIQDAASETYKLQVINYYSALDTSGHLTIRYEAN